MDLKLLLCFVMISPIFGENLPHPQNPQAMMELGRARSAWNFGGHHPTNRKVALTQWGRQRSSVPTAEIANRRQGTQPKSSGSKTKSLSHSPLGTPTSRQYKTYPKSEKTGKRTKVNRNSPSAPSHSLPMAPRAAAVPQTYYPNPFVNQPHRPSSTWNRGSRKLESRSDDTVMNMFRKKDLISLPGTPNVMKRRRKRSADLQQQQQQTIVTPPQSQQQPMHQMFAQNQRISQFGGNRKHYANHMGNGKSPMPPPSMNANLKIPATIIAPPKFDKSDLLSMLMGSGGVNPNEMGTILATNTRYVRFGRGLPNSGGGGTRQGRNLRWFPESSNNQVHNFNNNNSPSHSSVYPGASTSNQHQHQQPLSSSSNQIQSLVNVPQQQKQQSLSSSMKNNQISYLTPSFPQTPSSSNMHSSYSPPPPHKISVVAQQPQHNQQQQPSNMATPPLPLIVNVQIAPIGSRSQQSRGPVITVPVPSSQQSSYPVPSAPTSYQTDNMAASSSSPPPQKSKYGKNFKYSETWKPIYKDKHKSEPQKSFKYNYYSPQYNSDAMSESESKYFYKKVKQPAVNPLFDQLPEEYGFPSQTSDTEEENEVVPQMKYYDHIMSNVDIEYAGQSSNSANEDMLNEYLQAPFDSGQQNMDMEGSNNMKTFSFAVKRNNNNDNTNQFDFDMSSSSASTSDYNDDTSSSSLPAESTRDHPVYGDHDNGSEIHSDDLRTSDTVSSINHDADNNYYYSLVTKPTGNIPNPIFINVPKDNPFSNEIKK